MQAKNRFSEGKSPSWFAQPIANLSKGAREMQGELDQSGMELVLMASRPAQWR
jgi:hypothetical protein